MNLAQILTDRALAGPHRPALLFEDDVISYGELDRRSAVAAAALRTSGVRADDRVAIMLPNTPAYIAAYLGILRLGAIAVPLNSLLQRPEVSARLDASTPARFVEEPLGSDGVGIAEIVERDDRDPAAIFFTSGTTGSPRGVVLTHGGIRAAAAFGASALGFVPDDVIFGVAPFAHVLGQQVLISTFLAGGAVAVAQRFDAAVALEWMASTGVTILVGVPTMCTALCQAARDVAVLPPFRIAHIGGAAMPGELTDAVEKTFGAAVHEGYGLTEMSGLAATFRVGARRKRGSVGTPSEHTEMRIAPGAIDGVGEVQFRGPSVVAGFWNESDAGPATVDGDGWLSTGDIGRIDDDGDLFLVDRKKEMIIRGGYNVYPREVEEVLYAHPGVLEAAVLGIPDERLGEEVAAFVVARPDVRLDAAEVSEWSRERVAAYKYPRHVIIVDDLPKSPTGKILKRQIDVSALVPGGAGRGS